MNRFFAQSLLPSLILFAIYIFSLQELHSQEISQEVNDEVLLVDWKSMDCDDTYDPDRLKSRITFMEEVGGLLTIQVNFSDNCCADFTPGIKFSNNRLDLISATEEDNEFCFCDCCFSLEYKIAGLQGKSFEVYFDGKKVEVSDEHYETQEESSEFYKGERINFTNKYGFREGRWMSFHENGQVHFDGVYPSNVLYYGEASIWYKQFSEGGRLIEYKRKDSTQSWFDDGEIKTEDFTYLKGDTSFHYEFQKYDDRSLKNRSLEISYPLEVDPCMAEKRTKTSYLFKESYYEDGKRKSLLSNDTTYKWYENGNLDEVNFPGGSKRYEENGSLGSEVFRWSTPGPKCQDDLRYALYVYYDVQASIKKIYFTRDEAKGTKVYIARDYKWTWDENKRLTSEPEDWKEFFPWVKFELILEQLKEHEMP